MAVEFVGVGQMRFIWDTWKQANPVKSLAVFFDTFTGDIEKTTTDIENHEKVGGPMVSSQTETAVYSWECFPKAFDDALKWFAE